MRNTSMRLSTDTGRSRWIRALVGVITVVSVLTACGFAAPSSKQIATSGSPPERGCSPSSTASSTVTHNQMLYIAEAAFAAQPLTVSILAVDTRSGKQVWRTTVAQQGGDLFGQTLQVVNSVVYVSHVTTTTTDVNAVTALDAHNGHIIWKYTAEAHTSIGGIVVCNEMMYLVVGNNTLESAHLEARRTKDAGLLWWQPLLASGSMLMGGVSAVQLVVTNQGVFVASAVFQDQKKCKTTQTLNDCQLISVIHSFKSSNGQERWHSAPYSEPFSIVMLTATDQAVYVIKRDGVDSLQASDGALLWRQTKPLVGVLAKAMFNGVIYVAMMGQVVAIRASDGKQLWVHTGGDLASLVTGNGGLYTTNDGAAMNFCALDVRNGKIMWCSHTAKTSSMAVANESVVYTAANFESTVHALQKSNGNEIWQQQVPGNDRRVFALTLEQ